MKQWWIQLNNREKRLLMWGGGALVLVLFYWGVWQPINQGIESQQRKLTAAQETLSWVKEKGGQIAALRASSAVTQVSEGSIESQVDASARTQGINLTRIQPQQDKVNVWIDNVAFDKLLIWFDMLQKKGIVVQLLEIDKTSIDGFVKVRRLQLGNAL